MTQEEKAQAYDEAIKKVNDYYEGKTKLYSDVDKTLNYLFPQLKESEDEQHRKWILEYLYDGLRKSDKQFKDQFKSAIAWLEKQESVEEIVSRCKTSWYNEGKIQGQIEGLSDEEKYQQGWHDALEKQGVQKSKKISLWKHWKNGIAGNGEGKPIYLVKVGNTYSLTSCLGFECDYIELSELDGLMLEKQGEQKSKFSVGDTIKCKYDDRQFTIKSADLDKGTYTYTQEGCGNDIDYADEEFELVEQKPTDNQFTTEQASLLDKHIDKLIDQTLPDKYEWSGKIKSRKAKGVLKEMLDKKLKSIQN